MILCLISDADRYKAISPALAKAIDWLQGYNAEAFLKGDVELEDGIIVKSQDTALMPREKATLEAHRKYIDIHVPLKGTEIIGWAPVSGTKHLRATYNPELDTTLYGDAAHSLLHVKVGQMAIFFPEDSHAPNIGLGNHRKLCIKVPVE